MQFFSSTLAAVITATTLWQTAEAHVDSLTISPAVTIAGLKARGEATDVDARYLATFNATSKRDDGCVLKSIPGVPQYNLDNCCNALKGVTLTVDSLNQKTGEQVPSCCFRAIFSN
jgi:hypothetical protein